MTDGSREPARFLELLGALREGAVTDEEFAQLDHLLASDPALQHSYVEYMLLCAELRRYQGMPESEAILGEVVEQDRLSAEQQVAEQAQREAETHREAIRKAAEAALERFREQERLRQEERAYREHLARRRQLAVSVLTAVVLLVCTALIWISRWQNQTPAPVGPRLAVLAPVVATIVRSSHAQWDQADLSTSRGTRLTASAISLKQGLVELTFNGGADVLVQAPARLQLEGPDQLFLGGGVLSVTVAEGSSGFVVRTPTGTVVDYGTEFGVLVNKQGDTEALVYKGKVGLRSGSDPVRSVTSMMLTAGQAGAVDAAGSVVPRAFRPAQVVRKISKTPSFGIPGRRLDLSDVIGGGNGFGTGRGGAALSPVGSRQVELTQVDRSGRRQYAPVAWHRYIDGVFVPDGEASRTVSSEGHSFVECPATNNIYNMEITNIGDASCGHQLLDGLAYGSAGRPCILMHANLGITFDLAEIASANPGSQVARFSAGFGVSESATDRPCNADFWVLVDGDVRFGQPGVKRKGMVGEIDVVLTESDRFLTLITTDGGDPDGEASPHRSTDSDWCVFAKPILELVPATDAAGTDEGEAKGAL